MRTAVDRAIRLLYRVAPGRKVVPTLLILPVVLTLLGFVWAEFLVEPRSAYFAWLGSLFIVAMVMLAEAAYILLFLCISTECRSNWLAWLCLPFFFGYMMFLGMIAGH